MITGNHGIPWIIMVFHKVVTIGLLWDAFIREVPSKRIPSVSIDVDVVCRRRLKASLPASKIQY